MFKDYESDEHTLINKSKTKRVLFTPFLLICLYIFWYGIFNLELMDWGPPTIEKNIGVTILTICFILSVNGLIVLHSSTKFIRKLSVRKSIILVSIIIGVVFWLSRSYVALSWTLNYYEGTFMYIGFMAIRNAIIIILSLLICKLIVAVREKRQRKGKKVASYNNIGSSSAN